MDRHASWIFWMLVAFAVGVAYIAPPGAMRWTGIGVVGAVGLFFAGMNWAWLLGRAGGSMIPPVGAVLLCLAWAAIPITNLRWWAPVALAFDPWLGVMLFGMMSRKKDD